MLSDRPILIFFSLLLLSQQWLAVQAGTCPAPSAAPTTWDSEHQWKGGYYCMEDITSCGSPCTANDMDVTVFDRVSGDITCVLGQPATVRLGVVYQANQASRYDVGVIISQNGGNSYSQYLSDGTTRQTCLIAPLYQAESTAAPSPNCAVNPLAPAPSTAPYYCNLDGNLCGDLSGSGFVATHHLEGTQTFTCQDTNGDGMADLQVCGVWDQNSNGVCDNTATQIDAGPGTGAKCNCDSEGTTKVTTTINGTWVNALPTCVNDGPFYVAHNTLYTSGANSLTTNDEDIDATPTCPSPNTCDGGSIICGPKGICYLNGAVKTPASWTIDNTCTSTFGSECCTGGDADGATSYSGACNVRPIVGQTLEPVASSGSSSQSGTYATFNSGNDFTYTSAATYTGIDTFTYSVIDSELGTSASTCTVTMQVCGRITTDVTTFELRDNGVETFDFAVTLTGVPQANVRVNLAVTTDPVGDSMNETVTLSPSTLTFTPAQITAGTSQTVTATLTLDAGANTNIVNGVITVSHDNTFGDTDWQTSTCVEDATISVSVVDLDPNFTPLNGDDEHFVIAGDHPNLAVFNIITMPDFQYNARWVEYADHPTGRLSLTLENAFLVRRGNVEHRIKIFPDLQARLGNRAGSMAVTVDDKQLERSAETLVLFEATETQKAVTVQFRKHHCAVMTEHFILVVSMMQNTRRMIERFKVHGNSPNNWPFLNTEVIPRQNRLPAEIHGILGQTTHGVPYREVTAEEHSSHKGCVECYVKGDLMDYRERHLFGSDSEFNLYQSPSGSGRSRSITKSQHKTLDQSEEEEGFFESLKKTLQNLW